MEQKSYNVFGFEFKRKSKAEEAAQQKTFALPENEDGALVIQTGAYYGTYLNLEAFYKNDIDLINRYRDMAIQPEMETAIHEIVNESIVPDETGTCVTLNLDKIEELGDSVKKKISKEFDYILRMLNFSNLASELFKRWYVDGRMYFHIIVDDAVPKNGIKELRYIDPRYIRKIREIVKRKDPTGIELIKEIKEYYLYNPMGLIGAAYNNLGARISPDAVVAVASGLMDPTRSVVLSHLHKSIKPLNMLRMVEDSLVIYRLSRAPERRIFYIDTGTMPTNRAIEHVRKVRDMYRNKIVYDSRTGEIRDDRKYMSMQEDFWLPRAEGNIGTAIDTLPGAQNLSQIDDILYFEKKLYRSLGIPISRLESSQTFSLGRANEITRDEIRFSRLIDELRRRFSILFDHLLKTQLILKGICTEEEWKSFQNEVVYDFRKDNNYDELKEMEIMQSRFSLLELVLPHRGVLYSKEYIQKKILRMTEEEIEEMQQQIDKEAADLDTDVETTGKIMGTIPVDGAIDQQAKQAQATMPPTPMPPPPPPPEKDDEKKDDKKTPAKKSSSSGSKSKSKGTTTNANNAKTINIKIGK